jgi:hypothetical protein
MTTTHLYDLTVVVGEYQSNGQTKKRYKNIGKVLRNDKGQFAVIDRTFNPAGVPGDGDTIFVSMFEPRQKQGNAGGSQGYDQSPQGGGGRPSNDPYDGDAIPFAAEWRV